MAGVIILGILVFLMCATITRSVLRSERRRDTGKGEPGLRARLAAHRLIQTAGHRMQEQRWAEALVLFGKIEAESWEDPKVEASIEAARAYCHLRLDDGEAAVAAADRALRHPGVGASRLAAEHTLGAALLLLGHVQDALTILLNVVEQPLPSAKVEAECWYTLGEAQRLAGRDADARKSFEAAEAADPRSEWGQRARVRLSSGIYR